MEHIKSDFFCLQVRKAAQQGVCAILRGSDFLFRDNAPTHHPAAATTAKFCAKEIEQAGGAGNADAKFFVPLMTTYVPPPIRQQRGHHHPPRVGSAEGAVGDVSSGSCQVLLRDSATSDDTQPRGENRIIFSSATADSPFTCCLIVKASEAFFLGGLYKNGLGGACLFQLGKKENKLINVAKEDN